MNESDSKGHAADEKAFSGRHREKSKNIDGHQRKQIMKQWYFIFKFISLSLSPSFSSTQTHPERNSGADRSPTGGTGGTEGRGGGNGSGCDKDPVSFIFSFSSGFSSFLPSSSPSRRCRLLFSAAARYTFHATTAALLLKPSSSSLQGSSTIDFFIDFFIA